MVMQYKISPWSRCLLRLGLSRVAPTIASLTIAAGITIASLPAIAVSYTPIAPAAPPPTDSTDSTPVHPSEPVNPAHLSQGCPSDITLLAQALLEDFPGYYNRTLIRSRIPGESASSTRVVLASEPEILGAEDLADFNADFNNDAIEGFFFTTLERAYRDGQLVQQQGFHQIFLTRDVAGWLVVTTRSGYGGYPSSDRMTPPRESNAGLLVQTVRTWLRDCEAR
jgi:hypothetical protein